MEHITVDVTLGESKTHDMPERLLMPIGDVQCGVPACDTDRLKRHIEWGLKHDAIFIGMGDYVDMANPSSRRKLKQGDFQDTITEMVCEKAERDIAEFLSLVDGTAGLWLGLVTGHHRMDFPDGSNSDSRIAKALDAPYLGDTASIRVRLNNTDAVTKAIVDILVAHGQGSAADEPAALRKVMKWGSGFGFHDIVLNGHYHVKTAVKKPRPFFDGKGQMRHRNTLYAVTGSFLKGYLQGSTDAAGLPAGNYIEKAMFAPIALGGLVVPLRAKPD